MAKLWLIRARRRFSINGLFVRFPVEFVLVSTAGDVAVDDGDEGVTGFAELAVLFVDEFEFCSFRRVLVFFSQNFSLRRKKNDEKRKKFGMNWA